MKKFKNLHELYLNTLSETYRDYAHVSEPRGHRERENIGFNASIAHPGQRYCLSAVRKHNIVFCYAEALWYLSGNNDLDFVAHYAPSIVKYSADGKTLPGTGYGKRLMSFGESNMDQIERAIDILQNDDPDSKRVFLQIFDASENIYSDNIDVSCTIGLQLLLRSGRLHMVGMMRANDAYVGLLSDVFSFTFIQEYIASRLGCGMGSYHHMVGSIHAYDQNDEAIQTVLASHDHIDMPDVWPTMPSNVTKDVIATVLAFERDIRVNQRTFTRAALKKSGLNDYWIELLALFELYQSIKSGSPIDLVKLEGLHSVRRSLMQNKWPAQLGVVDELIV